MRLGVSKTCETEAWCQDFDFVSTNPPPPTPVIVHITCFTPHLIVSTVLPLSACNSCYYFPRIPATAWRNNFITFPLLLSLSSAPISLLHNSLSLNLERLFQVGPHTTGVLIGFSLLKTNFPVETTYVLSEKPSCEFRVSAGGWRLLRREREGFRVCYTSVCKCGKACEINSGRETVCVRVCISIWCNCLTLAFFFFFFVVSLFGLPIVLLTSEICSFKV